MMLCFQLAFTGKRQSFLLVSALAQLLEESDKKSFRGKSQPQLAGRVDTDTANMSLVLQREIVNYTFFMSFRVTSRLLLEDVGSVKFVGPPQLKSQTTGTPIKTKSKQRHLFFLSD